MKGKVIFAMVVAAIFCLNTGEPSSAATIIVTQQGLTFDPPAVNIAVGDKVRWEWTSGSHTTTSGINLSDPQAGTLWDETLNSMNSFYEHTFNTAGTFSYFCRPHVSLGMTGTVNVTDGCDCGTWGDVTGDGNINPVDVVFMVNKVYLGNDLLVQHPNCPRDAADINCDDNVNPVDVVFFVNKVYLGNDLFCADPCS